MQKILIGILVLLVIAAPFCEAKNRFKAKLPIQNIEVNRYLGTWYEIARIPNWFEKDLVGVTATYALKPNGDIEVKNAGFQGKLGGEKKTAIGNAWIPDPKKTGALQVSFFWPFSAGYNVVEIDPNYTYVLVSGDTPDYAWILSRQPTLNAQTYNRLIAKAEEIGLDPKRFETVLQPQ